MLQGATKSMPNQFSYTIHWQVNQILNSKLVNIAQSTNTVITFSQSLQNYIIRKHTFFLAPLMHMKKGVPIQKV